TAGSGSSAIIAESVLATIPCGWSPSASDGREVSARASNATRVERTRATGFMIWAPESQGNGRRRGIGVTDGGQLAAQGPIDQFGQQAVDADTEFLGPAELHPTATTLDRRDQLGGDRVGRVHGRGQAPIERLHRGRIESRVGG